MSAADGAVEGALDWLCSQPIRVSVAYCDDKVRRGLAQFNGNHQMPEWHWIREALARLPREDLKAIYHSQKAIRK